MINLKIFEFRQSLMDYVDESEIPPEVKRMVMKEIYDHVEKQSLSAVKEEIARREMEENAESIQQDTVGELSERGNSAE